MFQLQRASALFQCVCVCMKKIIRRHLEDSRRGEEEGHGQHRRATVHQFSLVREDFIELGTSVRSHGGVVDVIREITTRVGLRHDRRGGDRGDDEDDSQRDLGDHFQKVTVEGV